MLSYQNLYSAALTEARTTGSVSPKTQTAHSAGTYFTSQVPRENQHFISIARRAGTAADTSDGLKTRRSAEGLSQPRSYTEVPKRNQKVITVELKSDSRD